MLKRNRKTVILTTMIAALPILVGLLLWSRLPETIATHFDANGQPNGWSSRAFAVFGLPAFLVAVHLLCTFGTLMDPKRKNIQDKMYKLVLWICPVISIFTCGGVYLYALGVHVDMACTAELLVSVLFIVIGNYLPKCRQSYTMGIKLPWTLNDEENWNATHRFGGKVWFFGGIVTMLTAFFGNFWLLMVILAAMVILPTVYSYLYYRKHEKEKKNGN